jgi:hypothetical protein
MVHQKVVPVIISADDSSFHEIAMAKMISRLDTNIGRLGAGMHRIVMTSTTTIAMVSASPTKNSCTYPLASIHKDVHSREVGNQDTNSRDPSHSQLAMTRY